MPKDFKVAQLLELYGCLLPEKQRFLAECYYDDDLSLSEISENEGITRQGVSDSLKRAQQQLCEFEERLQLLKRNQDLQKEAERVAGGACADRLLEMINNL